MQVGPAISPLPEATLSLDLKEYAAHPLTFIRKHLADHGAEATRGFIERVEIYPFISDLLGEWLRRNSKISEASNFLTLITREVIGNMTLSELCAMLQAPLELLKDPNGKVEPTAIGGIFRELHLSSLAEKIEQQSVPIDPRELEQSLTAQSQAVEPTPNVSYSEFLSELKEAGVIIPPSAKERQSRVQAKRVPVADGKPTTAARVAKPKATVVKPAAAKPLTHGVESMLSPEAHEKIMLKIFRSDEDDFRRSMELINKAKDWKQASIYLDALFMRRKVDPYSKTATRLTDAVYARFHSVR
jgi:hypothetical protein